MDGAGDVRGVGVRMVPEVAEGRFLGGKAERRMGMVCRNIVVGPSTDLP